MTQPTLTPPTPESELVARLRDRRQSYEDCVRHSAMVAPAMRAYGAYDATLDQQAITTIERLHSRNSELVQSLDTHFGTPCEQIRHAQEVESARREGIEMAARWHDTRAHDTPDAFETEFHQVSAAAIRTLSSTPAMPDEMEKRIRVLRAVSNQLFQEGDTEHDKGKIARSIALDHIADYVSAVLSSAPPGERTAPVKIDTPDGPLYAEKIDGAIVHGAAPLSDAGREAMRSVVAATKAKLMDCSKCGRKTDLIGVCMRADCPIVSERVAAFKTPGEKGERIPSGERKRFWRRENLTNELGNEVTIEVGTAICRSEDGVRVEATGPDSHTEHWWTLKEFETLVTMGVAFLGSPPPAKAEDGMREVDDAMVRAAIATWQDVSNWRGHSDVDEAIYDVMRAALRAALAKEHD